MKKNNIATYETLFMILAFGCFLFSFYITINYANQDLLDMHSFRQSQTALTSYWLIKNGFSFAYETPVVGEPWSIPFEFPIYQYIVSLLAKHLPFSLNAVGRVVSFIFLTLCLIPVRAITKNLHFPIVVFYIFTALLFSSPLYLYWGRSFMIETTAIFFAVSAIKYFIDIVQERNTTLNQFLFLFFMSLGVLQKSTTGLPVLAVLCLVYYFLQLREQYLMKHIHFSRKIKLGLLYFGLPLIIGVTWIMYTDHVKSLNEFGTQITSNALNLWHWGTIHQRLSVEFYDVVLWQRIFKQNLAGMLGIAILLSAIFLQTKRQIKFVLIISLLLGLVPLFLFINLHIIHNYYQAANLIFLLYAVSISLGCILNHYLGEKIILFPLAIVFIASNYSIFYQDYLSIIKTVYNKDNSRDYAVAEMIKNEVPADKYFVAFGNDWSSSFAYLAERKSFTVSHLFNYYIDISLHPEQFIKEEKLGAVILCPPFTFPTLDELTQWASTGRHWKIVEVQGCYIASPYR